MQTPTIETAIPKHRYQLGPYQAVLLGEIESPDPVRYRYIMALVRAGDARPSVFVSCEKNPRAQAQDGSHRMRIMSEQMSEDLGSSDDYADAGVFAVAALAAAARVLGLVGITPVPE
jgi:hypothetical protein